MKEKKRGKKEKKKWDGTCPPGEAPSQVKRTVGTKGEIWGLSEGSDATKVCGKQARVRSTQMFCATALHSPAWDKCLLEWPGAGYRNTGIGEETWGEDLQRQQEGAGVRISTTRNTPEGSPDHYRSKAPLLSDVRRAEPLYPHTARVGTPDTPGSHCPCPFSPGLGADSGGWPTNRGGVIQKLSSRDCVTKEEELKQPLAAVQTTD